MKTELFTKERFLNADTPKHREVQKKLVLAMNEILERYGRLDEDEFDIFVEDALGDSPVPVRRASQLLEETGAYIHDDDGWRFNNQLFAGGNSLDWAGFTGLFDERHTVEDMDAATRDAIMSGFRWTLSAAMLAEDSGLKGMPAFFSCEDSEDMLVGVNVAETATSDALSLLCSSPERLSNCGRTREEAVRCLSFLLEKTISCQCTHDGWDKGGFYPLEDQPESYHPTTEATCLAVMALCTFYERRSSIEQSLSTSYAFLVPQVEQAVLQGLDFLFRMQRNDRSFGIYRYEHGDEAPSNENCTRMVQSTMGVCKGSGLFDQTERFDMYSACSKIISDTYTFFCSHIADAGSRQVWAPYFGKRAQDYSVADVVVSTARVCRSFIPVWWQMEDERDRIRSFNLDLLCCWRDNEEELRDKVSRYRFNSPAKDSFSAGEYFWAARVDMLAAFSVLQAHNLFGLVLAEEDWAIIDRAVYRTLELQHPHGHWDNPLASKTPFCTATLAAIELLLEYRMARGYD